MLVLTRREGESIVIGDKVVVTVLEVRGGQVRVGIQAPRKVRIHREEVYRQVTEANREAVASARVHRGGENEDPLGRLPQPRRSHREPSEGEGSASS